MVPLPLILMFIRVVLSQRIDVFPNTTILVLEGENVSIKYKLYLQQQMWRTVLIKPSSHFQISIAFFHNQANNECVNTGIVSDRYKVSCDLSNLLFRLDIYNVTKKQDNMSYICELRINGTDKRSKITNSTRIKVKDPAQCIEIKPRSLTVIKDEKTEIECKATCYSKDDITIIWYKEMSGSTAPKVISNNSANAYSSEYVSKLTYKGTENDTNGFFYCTATYAFTKQIITSEKVKVSVKYGPQNIMVSVNVNSIIGEEIKIRESKTFNANCTADCFPLCDVQWWTINNNNSTQIHNSELFIANISRQEAGPFVCHANNSIGINNKTINVIVIYSSNITDIRFTNNKTTIDEQENTTIECSADGYPLPNITWLRNGEQIHYEQLTTNSTLSIVKAYCNHTGNYTCSSYNGIGENKSEHIELYVNCKPRIIGSESHGLEIGGEKIITVNFFAYPLPNVTWYLYRKNDRSQKDEITNTSMFSIENYLSLYTSRLHVNKVGGGANGRYRIEICNSLGNDSKEIDINGIDDISNESKSLINGIYLATGITLVSCFFCSIFFISLRWINKVRISKTREKRIRRKAARNGERHDGLYRDNSLYIPCGPDFLNTKEQEESRHITEPKPNANHSSTKEKGPSSCEKSFDKGYDGSYRDNSLYVPCGPDVIKKLKEEKTRYVDISELSPKLNNTSRQNMKKQKNKGHAYSYATINDDLTIKKENTDIKQWNTSSQDTALYSKVERITSPCKEKSGWMYIGNNLNLDGKAQDVSKAPTKIKPKRKSSKLEKKKMKDGQVQNYENSAMFYDHGKYGTDSETVNSEDEIPPSVPDKTSLSFQPDVD